MSDRDLRRMLQLCQEALARPAGERDAFLDESCGGDAELRGAVVALLAEQSATAGFLDTPAWTPERPPLTAGTRLRPYEVQSLIGAGGMGEVYKARDTRLDRTVAIKVLPPGVAAHPERRARFEGEAKAIAGLSHPHICTLHDVGRLRAEGAAAGQGAEVEFLVMEHLEGETLAERLRKGRLPLDQALTVATEIADALAAAHRQGVIHRDLKPGNVMLTKAGAKLLDFGLAKLKGHGDQPVVAHLAAAPTEATLLTGEGVILGTLQYMAPEQLEGEPADARTDLWALGAILYETVAGRHAFEGSSPASLIAAILAREPASLPAFEPLKPPAVDRLVRHCLAKAPDDRPDTAHDLANELRLVRETSGVGVLTGAQPRRRRGLRAALTAGGGLVLLAATVVGAAVIGAALMWLFRPAPPRAPLVRSTLEISPAADFMAGGMIGGNRTLLTWTPDGALVFVGRRAGVRQLYVLRLDAEEARPLPNTQGALEPAVSPDGAKAEGGSRSAAFRPDAMTSHPTVSGSTRCRCRRPRCR